MTQGKNCCTELKANMSPPNFYYYFEWIQIRILTIGIILPQKVV